ncbi:MAG: hypothetical protein KJ923_05835, partial [Candidatus Omnitrophica bacterium]|nr:hypothetical protein [Candidatus Omnitrophota bacterium]
MRKGAIEVVSSHPAETRINKEPKQALKQENPEFKKAFKKGLVFFNKYPYLKVLYEKKYGKAGKGILIKTGYAFIALGINILNSITFLRPISLSQITYIYYNKRKPKTEEKLRKAQARLKFAQMLDVQALHHGSSMWTLSIIGAEIGGVVVLGEFVGGPFGTLALVLEGKDGAISFGDHLYTSVENSAASWFGIETPEGEGIVSGAIYRSTGYLFGVVGSIPIADAYVLYRNGRWDEAAQRVNGLIKSEEKLDKEKTEKLENQMVKNPDLSIKEFIKMTGLDSAGDKKEADKEDEPKDEEKKKGTKDQIKELFKDNDKVIIGDKEDKEQGKQENVLNVRVRLVELEDIVNEIDNNQKITIMRITAGHLVTVYALNSAGEVAEIKESAIGFPEGVENRIVVVINKDYLKDKPEQLKKDFSKLTEKLLKETKKRKIFISPETIDYREFKKHIEPKKSEKDTEENQESAKKNKQKQTPEAIIKQLKSLKAKSFKEIWNKERAEDLITIADALRESGFFKPGLNKEKIEKSIELFRKHYKIEDKGFAGFKQGLIDAIDEQEKAKKEIKDMQEKINKEKDVEKKKELGRKKLILEIVKEDKQKEAAEFIKAKTEKKNWFEKLTDKIARLWRKIFDSKALEREEKIEKLREEHNNLNNTYLKRVARI